MNFVLIALVLALVALTVYTVRLAGKVDDINEELDDVNKELGEMDADLYGTLSLVGTHVGALTARADRLEIQLGRAANSGSVNYQTQVTADVFAVLDEARAAVNDPVVKGFVGFPQDYDPTYHFGGLQLLPKSGDTGRDYSRDV